MSVSTDSPNKSGQDPRVKWALIAAGAVMALFLVVVLAKWLRALPDVQEWLAAYPGHYELAANAPVGLPAWLGWQHFLNALMLILIIRSGWLVRTTARPKAFWTRNQGFIKTRNKPQKISLELWFHLFVDGLWLLNGVIFVVLLFSTGQWMRIVPTSWEVFPNAVSAALQYASLEWPHENGWVNYNSLQQLTYFVTVFLAAPAAMITGLRMSPAWPKGVARLDRAFPVELARAVHFPVMLYFVLFIISHVTLVFTTGALRNLNHMYGATDEDGWLGFWFFAASLLVMIGCWLLARPLFLRPVASLMGRVSK